MYSKQHFLLEAVQILLQCMRVEAFGGGGTPILPFFVRRVPTLPGKPWKKWNFVIFFSKPGKCLEFPQKVVKTGNFNLKPGKNVKFANSMFQASLFKMSFTKIILICFFVISTLSTQTLIRSQIDIGFHCFYLKITWKIHGILCHKRSGNPASVLTHFEIFITKICMKVPEIWHTKNMKKTLEFRTKNLEKTWNLVFGKKWEPCVGINIVSVAKNGIGSFTGFPQTWKAWNVQKVWSNFFVNIWHNKERWCQRIKFLKNYLSSLNVFKEKLTLSNKCLGWNIQKSCMHVVRTCLLFSPSLGRQIINSVLKKLLGTS